MKAEYDSSEITTRVIKYYGNIIGEADELQPTWSLEPSKYPNGIVLLDAFGRIDQESTIPSFCKYGALIHINDAITDGSIEIMIPYTPSYADNSAKSIYIRSRTDGFSSKKQGWCEWRRLAYIDEIESIVNSVLSSKGLI